jgi:hypothetical protein
MKMNKKLELKLNKETIMKINKYKWVLKQKAVLGLLLVFLKSFMCSKIL